MDLLNPGSDVLIGGNGADALDGGGADDIAGLGDSDLTTYNPDTVTGGNGFDWATYTTGAFDPTGTTKPGADVDLALTGRAAGDLRQQDMDVFPLDDVEAVSGGPATTVIAGDGRTSFVSPTGSDGRLTPGAAPHRSPAWARSPCPWCRRIVRQHPAGRCRLRHHRGARRQRPDRRRCCVDRLADALLREPRRGNAGHDHADSSTTALPTGACTASKGDNHA